MCVEKLNATDIAGSGRSATTGGGAEFTTAVVFLCLISIVLVVLVGIMLSQVILIGHHSRFRRFRMYSENTLGWISLNKSNDLFKVISV